MVSASSTPSWTYPSLADVMGRVGDVRADRVFVYPAVGTAPEEHLFDNRSTLGLPCELVDGILVAKRTRRRKDPDAARVARAIRGYLSGHNVGFVAGADPPIRLRPGLVRRPDVFFIRSDTIDAFEDLIEPGSPIFGIRPDLVVDVISPWNTDGEMASRLEDYAAAGVPLVWYLDSVNKRVAVYPQARTRRKRVLGLGGVLGGGNMLPGFILPVAMIFEKRAPAKKGGRKSKPGRG